MKQYKALFLAVIMLLSVMLFTACGGSGSTEADYKVTVVDALGAPVVSGYAVRFLQNGQQVAMQLPNEKGEAVKTLTKGDYTVELQFTDSKTNYHLDASDMALSADKTELKIVLAYALPEQGSELYVESGAVEAFHVGVGGTHITLDAENRSYFLFAPTEAGLYEFSLLNNDAAIGYYGAPHFVQQSSAAEVINNKFTVSVRADSLGAGGFVLVIGVDAGQGSGILSIARLGDPEWTVADEPWTIYNKTVELSAYTLPAGAALKDFDLTAPTGTYELVLGSDGFYHLGSADGALVLVRLGKTEAGVKYLAPFEEILEHSGVNKYFFDEDGNFVKKERYDNCLLEYIACVDEATGVYPLTEDLKYIIQQRGDYSGWWDPDNSLYLFVDSDRNKIPGINNETAWLFMCCYIG